MESEEIITLEYVSGELDRMVKELSEQKRWLDTCKDKISQIHEKEKEFHSFFSKAKKLQKNLKLFFDEAEEKGLQSIDQSLRSIEGEYKEKVTGVETEIKAMEFNMDGLESSGANVVSFLSQMVSLIGEINKRQREVFEGAIKEVNERLNILGWLLTTLIKKIEGVEDEGLKKPINEKRNEINQIKIPLNLEETFNMDEKLLKGFYIKVKEKISLCRQWMRDFAIKNRLLSEKEIVTLEAVYEVLDRESEFNEAVAKLKEKLGFQEHILQSVLLDLSRKGFVTLKMIAE